jgi:NTE family protein
MTWDPAAIHDQVKVTPAELLQIHARMDGQPKDTNGKYPVDAVFEGGGVWGTAFLGAVRCCEDVGVSWLGLAGTSAGAITCSLLAAGYTAAELEAVFADLDYMRFVKEKTYPLGFDSDPSNDLEDPKEVVALLTSLMLHGKLGRYKSDPFHDWLAEKLQAKGVTKFGDVFKSVGTITDGAGTVRNLPRQLRVVATDLTNGRMRVLPDAYLDAKSSPLDPNARSLKPELAASSIAHAVRCSMSIPGFFEPAGLPGGYENSDAVIVDGGVLSNFPLWLFDDAPGQIPGWPTFGFRLTEGADQPRKIVSVTNLLSAMFRTMMSASDLYYLGKAAGNRVTEIDLSALLQANPKLTATAFKLTGEDQANLYRTGYLSAKKFFMEQWNWKEHIKTRTFSDTAVAAAEATGG